MAKKPRPPAITADQLLAAYANGYFPMALNRQDADLYWFCPEERGVLPLDRFNVPRGLARAMKKRDYRITVDQAFEPVIRACGTLTPTRRETWINETIVRLYTELAGKGRAHSIEVWYPRAAVPLAEDGSLPVVVTAPDTGEDYVLAGGLYGVSLGRAFFGESMFSRAPDASKIALVSLVIILKEAGYQLLDTQYVNEHLQQFGIEAWSKRRYLSHLAKALELKALDHGQRFTDAAARIYSHTMKGTTP